jgi:hypothetical protein
LKRIATNGGQWIPEVPELPNVLAYGAPQEETTTKAEALALRVLTKNNLTVLQNFGIQM